MFVSQHQQLSCLCVIGSYKGTRLGENMIFLFPSWSLCNVSLSFIFFLFCLFLILCLQHLLSRWSPWGEIFLLLGQVSPIVKSPSLWVVNRLMGEARLDNGIPCPTAPSQ